MATKLLAYRKIINHSQLTTIIGPNQGITLSHKKCMCTSIVFLLKAVMAVIPIALTLYPARSTHSPLQGKDH